MISGIMNGEEEAKTVVRTPKLNKLFFIIASSGPRTMGNMLISSEFVFAVWSSKQTLFIVIEFGQL